jgi:hypothetical protein
MPTDGKKRCRGGHVTILYHLNALAKQQRRDDLRFDAERDRRYTENASLRAEALQIKSVADKTALDLNALNQAWKDEKANNLREQISGERGNYPTKMELAALGDKFSALIDPLTKFVSAAQGQRGGFDRWVGWLFGGLMAAIAFYNKS